MHVLSLLTDTFPAAQIVKCKAIELVYFGDIMIISVRKKGRVGTTQQDSALT
jgi:hypothetical protein